jgi:hypothetical protein
MNTTAKTLVSLMVIIFITAGCNTEGDSPTTDNTVIFEDPVEDVIEDPVVETVTAPAWETHGFERCTILMGGYKSWDLYDRLLRDGHENGLSYAGMLHGDTSAYGDVNWFNVWDNLILNPVGCDFGGTVDIIFMVESNDPDKTKGSFSADISSVVANFYDISKYLKNVYILPVPLVPDVVCTTSTRDPVTGFTTPTLDPHGLNYSALAEAIEELDGREIGPRTIRKGPELHYETCEQMKAGPFWIQEQFLLKYGTEY